MRRQNRTKLGRAADTGLMLRLLTWLYTSPLGQLAVTAIVSLAWIFVIQLLNGERDR